MPRWHSFVLEGSVQKILTAQATEGMVLAREVEAPDGRVLCGKGTVLTSSLVLRLQQMDIPSVTVDGHPLEVAGELTIEAELQAIEARFSRVTNTPPLMYIKKKIMERAVAARHA